MKLSEDTKLWKKLKLIDIYTVSFAIFVPHLSPNQCYGINQNQFENNQNHIGISQFQMEITHNRIGTNFAVCLDLYYNIVQGNIDGSINIDNGPRFIAYIVRFISTGLGKI